MRGDLKTDHEFRPFVHLHRQTVGFLRGRLRSQEVLSQARYPRMKFGVPTKSDRTIARHETSASDYIRDNRRGPSLETTLLEELHSSLITDEIRTAAAFTP